MKPTQEQRDERFTSINEVAQSLYSSPENGLVIQRIFDKYGLSRELYREYALTIGDVILGFYPKSQLPKLLEQNLSIPTATAQQITADLRDFLAPIEEVIAPNTTPSVLSPMPQTITPATVQTPRMTEIPSGIPGARTMHKDIDTIRNTGPTQSTPATPEQGSAIPRYAKPLTDLPRYDTPPGQQ